MVVNRKQPAAPVPLVQSRSTSQQPIVMRKKQSKFTITSHKPEHSLPTNPKPKPKSPSQSRPRKRKISLRDKLILWFISLFALYSVLFCSPYTTTFQKSQTHLICRAETNYKTYILEPFILPPLRHTLSYTHSLAEPYLEPYLAPVRQVTSIVKPYLIQAATTTKSLWKGTVTPFYKYTLKPYYQSAILPRYNLYLRPLVAHLERYYAHYISNPIRFQFNRLIHSYISHLQPYIHRCTSTVHTIWLFSLDFYATYIQPTLLSTWIRAQPHLYFAFDQAKVISLNAAAGTAKHLKGLANQLGTQRRTYVDPHIRKIWDKVEENATAKMTTVPVGIREETAESIISASLVVGEATTTTKESEEVAQNVLHPAEPTPPPTSPTPSPSTQKEAQSAVSVADTSAHGASTSPFEFVREVEASFGITADALYELEREVEALFGITADVTTSGVVENLEPEPTQTSIVQAEEPTKKESPNESATSTQEESSVEASLGSAPNPSTAAAAGVIGVGASTPSDPTTAEEDDLDDFLRDIGIDTSSSSSPSPSATQLSEADEAAAAASAAASAQEAESSRLASIASKRLAITTRHTKFETDLRSAIQTSTSQVIQKLNEMRVIKKEELISMTEGNTQGQGEGLVVGLTLGGEKLMNGLDVYLKKCQGRSGNWKQRGVDDGDEDVGKRSGLARDEQSRLEAVIEKVEIKFLDMMQKIQEQVTEWYSGVVRWEQQEISQITMRIKSMAEQAQASLGMDYAWLEDVTYMDWQRYHDLVGAADKFEQTAIAIQAGTSSDPPSSPNPIKPVIDELQEDLQNVVLGFHVALDGVRNMIPELFDIYGFGNEGGVGEEEGDQVRIQPIDPDVGNGEEMREFDASKIIIGKSKEQIERDLGDVPLVVAKHEEL